MEHIDLDDGYAETTNSLEQLALAPNVLELLSPLDLTNCIVFKDRVAVAGGAYRDISIARLDIEGQRNVKVAVKRFRLFLKDDVKLLLEKEVYVWSKLKHENLLPLVGYAFDKDFGFPMLVSEWMENGSAWTYVHKNQKCDLLWLITGIARGLNYLHNNDTIHSDIKSDNVLVSNSGDALICDFGYTHMTDASRSLGNISTGINGTPQYLAYELLNDSETYSKHSKKSDVWAFGMTVYELYTHRRPYSPLYQHQVIPQILQRKLPSFPSSPVNSHDPCLAEFLRIICEKCWTFSPSERLPISNILDILQERLFKKEGSDWSAVFNSKMKRILDVNLTKTLSHDGIVTCVRFSSDGKYLATGCNHTAKIYETTTWRKIWTSYLFRNVYVLSVCFSPNGKLLATGADDKIRIWNIAQKHVKRILEGHSGLVNSVDFSRDGRILVSASIDRTTRIWDMKTGMQKVLEGGNAEVTGVAISPDGRLVAVGSFDSVVRIWEVQTGNLVERLEGHRDPVLSVAFTPDGKRLISGSVDKTLKQWNISAIVAGSSHKDTFPTTSSSESASNGAVVHSNDTTNNPNEGDGESGRVSALNFTGHEGSVSSVAVTHDGQWVVSGSSDNSVRIWEAGTADMHCMLEAHKMSMGEILVDLSPSGGILATISRDMRVRIWPYTVM